MQTASSLGESTPPLEPASAAVPETAAAEEPAAIQPLDDAIQVVDAPSLVPPLEHDAAENAGEENTEAEQADIESFAARRERLQARRKQTQSRSRWTAVFLVLLAFNVALVFGRDDVVRYLPQTASLFATIGLPVNLRHLAFEDVKVTHNAVDGIPVLLVEGKIVSNSEKPTEVPRLRFAARSAKGQELYTWTALPSRNVLGPGETLAFHSRLASPPADAVDIMVRFFGSRDRIAAVK
ncbi:MAG TPA: thioredoxin [Pseudolabrys sp.]|nr:thioredoxin [Pseudolabrys sp.]